MGNYYTLLTGIAYWRAAKLRRVLAKLEWAPTPPPARKKISQIESQIKILKLKQNISGRLIYFIQVPETLVPYSELFTPPSKIACNAITLQPPPLQEQTDDLIIGLHENIGGNLLLLDIRSPSHTIQVFWISARQIQKTNQT